jgi:hypothetical protein
MASVVARPDAFPTGDNAPRLAIQPLYGFDHVSTEDERIEPSNRSRSDRSLAVSYAGRVGNTWMISL